MAETLSFGFVNPEDGDPASVWQPAINSTIEQLNDHNHDGVNSATISPASISTLSTAVLSGNWVGDGNGNFTQTISAPPAVTEVNDFYPKSYVDSTGEIVYLSSTRASSTTLTLTTNNPVAMTVVWT